MTQPKLSAEQERDAMRLRDYVQQQAKMTGTEAEALMPVIRDYVRYRAQNMRAMQPVTGGQTAGETTGDQPQAGGSQAGGSQVGAVQTLPQSLQQDHFAMMVREARSLQCTGTCLHETLRMMTRAMERGANGSEAMSLTSNILRDQAKERGQARGTWTETELAQVRTQFDERLDDWEKMNLKRLEQERSRREAEARGPTTGTGDSEARPQTP
jgi:hypothetical protein